MSEKLNLDAIEARVNAATLGPWTTGESGSFVCGENEYIISTDTSYCPPKPDDCAFIAAAREDVPALLARVHELEGELDTMHDVLEANGLDYNLLVEYAGEIGEDE